MPQRVKLKLALDTDSTGEYKKLSAVLRPTTAAAQATAMAAQRKRAVRFEPYANAIQTIRKGIVSMLPARATSASVIPVNATTACHPERKRIASHRYAQENAARIQPSGSVIIVPRYGRTRSAAKPMKAMADQIPLQARIRAAVSVNPNAIKVVCKRTVIGWE